MSTTPNTTWWMCISPTLTLRNQPTFALISRTLTRVATKAPMSATKKQNSGSRPVSTMLSSNQFPMTLKTMLRGQSSSLDHLDRETNSRQERARQPRRALQVLRHCSAGPFRVAHQNGRHDRLVLAGGVVEVHLEHR